AACGCRRSRYPEPRFGQARSGPPRPSPDRRPGSPLRAAEPRDLAEAAHRRLRSRPALPVLVRTYSGVYALDDCLATGFGDVYRLTGTWRYRISSHKSPVVRLAPEARRQRSSVTDEHVAHLP